MDIMTAVSSLRNGQAAKLPSFSGGYVKRTDVAKQSGDTWDSKYRVTFVKYSSGSSTPTEYEYVVTETDGKLSVAAPSSALPVDGQLFAALFLSTDWAKGDTADFEAARTNYGGMDW